MGFEKISCTDAFYDDYYGTVFYHFDTVPQIGHGNWAISEGGDVAYDLVSDNVTQMDYPEELGYLVEYIPDDIKIDGLEE